MNANFATPTRLFSIFLLLSFLSLPLACKKEKAKEEEPPTDEKKTAVQIPTKEKALEDMNRSLNESKVALDDIQKKRGDIFNHAQDSKLFFYDKEVDKAAGAKKAAKDLLDQSNGLLAKIKGQTEATQLSLYALMNNEKGIALQTTSNAAKAAADKLAKANTDKKPKEEIDKIAKAVEAANKKRDDAKQALIDYALGQPEETIHTLQLDESQAVYLELKSLVQSGENVLIEINSLYSETAKAADDAAKERQAYQDAQKNLNDFVKEIFVFGENWTITNKDWEAHLNARFKVVDDKCYQGSCNFVIQDVKEFGGEMGNYLFHNFAQKAPQLLRCKSDGGVFATYWTDFVQSSGLDLIQNPQSSSLSTVQYPQSKNNAMTTSSLFRGDSAIVIIYKSYQSFKESYEKNVQSKCFKAQLGI